MSDFFEELAEGEIDVRDKYQFELKSLYRPIKARGDSSYTTEFYLFIPQALQINPDTYNAKQFYRDQTTLIRYKTPLLSFQQLIEDDPRSPLLVFKEKITEKKDQNELLHELKLFANIVRSRLRDRTNEILTKRGDQGAVLELCDQVEQIKERMRLFFSEVSKEALFEPLKCEWDYIDEYISLMIEHYLTNLLEYLRNEKLSSSDVDARLCQMINAEEKFRSRKGLSSHFSSESAEENSRAIYRLSLLNKYIFDVLFLKIMRKEPRRRFREISAMVAAGIAMLIYLVLLAWRGSSLLIDSTAFIALAVILYILKDRLKEGIRHLSTRIASKLYPDYTTEILSPDKFNKIGRLMEYFSFISDERIPSEIVKIRESHFHDELERIRRQETVIYFKKMVEIYPQAIKENYRLREVNDIFRFNLSQFLLKASDAKSSYPHLDPTTNQLETIDCEKLYHVNIIMRKSYTAKGDKRRIEFDKFRIILNKEGIEGVRKIS